MVRRLGGFLWVLIATGILVPGAAFADVLYVNSSDPACNGGSPCFGTLQAAVDVATAGDVVRLQAGTYVEQVLVADRNNFSGASEADRIVIEADPEAPAGSVVLDGAKDHCTYGQAIAFSRSRFVTLRGLVITGAGGQAIWLKGGANANDSIHIERNRIFGNGSNSCNGGITANRGTSNTLIANNLIYGNGRNGIAFKDATGGPHRIVGNTIHANGWSGVWAGREHLVLLANNAITQNGTQTGATGGRFGVNREGSTGPQPEGIELRSNLVCGNRLGEINGPALDETDSENLTPTGGEGPGVVASPGCELVETVFTDLGDPASADLDFSLAEGSPAVDAGLDPRSLGLGAALDPLFEADFAGEAQRPLDGDGDGTDAFDQGALERGAAGPPPGDPPTLAILDPADGMTVADSSLTVTGTATDADTVNVNGVPAALADESFTATLVLEEGTNAVIATASNAFGTASQTIQVTLDAPPAIAITDPADGTLLVEAEIVVSGTVSDATGLASVTVNGVAADVVGDAFSATVTLAVGDTLITATATDTFGSSASDSITVTRGEAPILAISAPAEGVVLGTSPVTVTGSFSGTAPVEVTVEGTPATVSGGTFSAEASLVEGTNPLTVTASNAFGAETQVVTVTLDATAPAVAITAPPDGTLTTLSIINVEGTVADANAITSVMLNGVPVSLSDGAFSAGVALALGTNAVTAVATDVAGNAGSATVTVSRGDPPTVAITAPAGGSLLAASPVAVAGTAPGADAVLVNGQPASLVGEAFTASVALVEGANTLTATAANAFGSAQASVSVTLDTLAPQVSIDVPPDGTSFDATPVGVFGSVTDASPIVALDVNGVAQAPGSAFAATVDLELGENSITVTATDAAGHVGSASVSVTLVEPEPLSVSIVSPGDGDAVTTATVSVSGTVNAAGATVTVNGLPAAVTETGFELADLPLVPNTNLITAVATLGAETATHSVAVVRVQEPPPPPPPDPEDVAPPVDSSVATTVTAATEFLYTGDDPIQTGVDPETIDLRRAAVIRGHVRLRSGAPVESARISVLGHPEFGETLTRQDGMFDLAINGGGVFTVTYEKGGFLPAQRQVEALWQEIRFADDVVMVPYDPGSTPIDLSQPAPMQVARGSVVSDGDGSRQSTILFPQNTAASMRMPGGSLVPLSGPLTVRATEYTVGETGPEAMPAMLPPTSGYTYAFELSVDEAVTAGAQSVEFSQALPYYVENFLDLDVGVTLPFGSYDFEKAGWVPEESGRVIEVVSITSGYADLDVDGDGAADAGGPLDELSITAAEREALATLYQPGDTLWRVQVEHFTPFDINFPRVIRYAAENAIAWGLSALFGANNDNQCQDENGRRCGSIIAIQNQGLRESVAITGTPFRLHYSSERVPGRKLGGNSLRIPLSDADLPSTVTEIELEVQVAGQRIRETFSPQADLTAVVDWDGLDGYGRPVQGRQNATVRVGYAYDAQYQTPTRFYATNYGGASPGASFARDGIMLSREFRTSVGGWDARGQGLGGWTLDVHHAYDPNGKVLHLGNGERRSVGFLPRVLTRIAGGTQVSTYPNTGDGGPAIDALFSYYIKGIAVDEEGRIYVSVGAGGGSQSQVRVVAPDGLIDLFAGGAGGCSWTATGVGGPADEACLGMIDALARGPDGNLYVNNSPMHRILRVTPAGILEDFAGLGSRGYTEDGIPAIDAGFGIPIAMDAAPDGTVYVVDNARNNVRIVTPDEIIHTVAGNGDDADSGDGGAALEAGLRGPNEIELGPGGSLYIATSGRVRRVTPDGRIETIAGGGSPADGIGDGGPATEAKLGTIQRLVVAPDGGLYIATGTDSTQPAYGPRIRYVDPAGMISTVVGTGVVGGIDDGAPAEENAIGVVTGMALGPDGSLYLATKREFPNYPYSSSIEALLLKVSNVFPDLGIEEAVIPSEDGEELYVFNGATGRHLGTLDALTGGTLLTFEYDTEGRLVGIADAVSNLTTIERNAGGEPTAIVAPFGQRTELGLHVEGYLSSATNPASESFEMTYQEGGLLETFQRPSGDASAFEYDALGRLVRDEDAAGGFQTLTPADSGLATTVTIETTLGRTHSYRLEEPAVGEQERIETDAAGFETVTVIRGDRERGVELPDGTDVALTQGYDPRFGLLAPVIESASIATPGGRLLELSGQRTATYQTPGDAGSGLATQTDTLELNGRTYTRTFEAASGEITTETPEGRLLTRKIDSTGRTTRLEVDGLLPIDLAYDATGRLEEIVQGTGAEERRMGFAYDADGLLAQVADPLLRPVDFAYDAAGRATRQTLPDGRFVDFTYDLNGNLTSLTPPGQPAHIFRYTPVDLEGEYEPPPVAGIADPRTFFDYDLDRQLDLVTRPDGATIDLQYDTAGRLAAIVRPAGVTTLGYDAGTGRLSTILAPGGEGLAFGYDGLLWTGTTWSGTVAGTVSQTYDDDFRIASQSVDGGSTVSFGYDGDGFLTQAGALVLGRDPLHGLVTGTTLGSVTTSRGYSGFGELASDAASFGATAFYANGYLRDALGRITQKTETIQGVTTTFDYGYDLAGRLEEVRTNSVVSASYGYDANGNRLSVTTPGGTVAGSYDAQDRLTSYGDVSYAYTANGELLSKTNTASGETTSSTYDTLGNLTSVSLPDGRLIEYVIDGANRRVGKKVNGVLVQAWLYGDQLNPVAELDGLGNVVARFVYGSKANVPDTMVKGGVSYRILSDHLGSPRLVVDAVTGAVVQRVDYGEFGRVTQDTTPGFQPFGFAGGLYDADTGLVRFGARDFDAEVGRWTAKDPIRFAGGDPNLYGYVLGDPVNLVDPDGQLGDVTASVSGGVGRYGGSFSVTLTEEGDLDFDLIVGSGFGLGASLTADFGGSLGDPEAPSSCPNAGNAVPPLVFAADAGTGLYGGSVSGTASPSGVSGKVGVGLGIGFGTAFGVKVF